MSLWHAVGRELTGAWRSLRYDLDLHRAAKLANAYTEEFTSPDLALTRPNGLPPQRARRSRMVPVWGVATLVVGGAAGAYLAIGGGLAAMGTDHAQFEGDRPGVTTWAPQPEAGNRAGRADRAEPAGTGSRPAVGNRPGARPAPAPAGPAMTVGTPAGPAVPESTPGQSHSAVPSASATPSTSAAASPSASASTERSEYHAPGAGR